MNTLAGGYYYFDILKPGSYYVRIPATEFATGRPLAGYLSSTGADSGTVIDLNDNGIDNAAPLTNGIQSNTFMLAVGTMPTGEDQTAYTGGLPDANVNATDDFGFVAANTLVAIGNRVWIDNGAGTGGVANDGIQNGTEAGVSGVTVLLFDSSNAQVGTTTTDTDGFYFFDNLQPGSYYVQIPATEFGSGKPLEGLLSSTGADATTTTDLNDNGIDNVAPAVNGIRSNSFTLAVGSMPTGEDQTGYTGGLPDANVNATNDFGFMDPKANLVAIGNRVWLDDGLGGGLINNGRIDGTEAGIANVAVEIYDDSNNLIAATHTDVNGRYYFDNLVPGSYYVLIPVSEFGTGRPLVGLSSSTDVAAKDAVTDDITDENGIDDAAPATNGIRSNLFTLSVGGEPTDDDQTGYTGVLPNSNVNATDDFGFYNVLATKVAIGNRVWLDDGRSSGVANNGARDGGEVGIDDATVELYNGGGTLITSTTTSGGGYYWFDNLSPGQYYVLLPAGQFQTGGVLAGLFSSTGAGTDEITDEGLDENGRDVANPASTGIRSTTFNLQPGTEVTGELQTGYPGGLPDDSVNGTADFGLVNGAAVLVAIGNRVWLDDGSGGGLADDGVINGTEAGIDGVDVQLYDSANQLIATTVTSGGGYYFFDILAGGAYYAAIPASEFGSGQPLAGLLSSTNAGNDEINDSDVDENGIDDPTPATNGIVSNTFTLSAGNERTGEDQTGYLGVLPDANVNATDDFGFYNPLTTNVAIGNRVWLDNGASGGIANDHIQNGGEAGIPNVTVGLYTSVGGFVRNTQTDANGNYWFDNLAPGQYYVRLAPAEFLPGGDLVGLVSSTGAGSDESTDQDVDENGIDEVNPAVNGIRSNTFNLQAGSERVGEDQSGYGGSLPDNSVNGTNDFGLIAPAQTLVAIGNRVWLDNGAGGGVANDGIFNGGEAGIAGVAVQLYDPANTLAASTVTDANGLYWFDNLAPGNYYVTILASEFGSGKPLDGLLSSTDAGTDQGIDDDVDENGIDTPNPASSGIRSGNFTLSVGGAPVGEAQDGYAGVLPDASVNATDDFGFIVPASTLVAIGNLVFHDTNGNGRYEPGLGETPINAVTVDLFFEGDDPATVAPYRTTTTAGGGFYLFDNLPEGRYFVLIPKEEFATGGDLVGLASSPGAGGDNALDDNVDENGIDGGTPASQGVRSGIIDLAVGHEPTGEQGAGSYTGSLPDANVNLTVDFGYVPAAATCTTICDVYPRRGVTAQLPNGVNSLSGDAVVDINDIAWISSHQKIKVTPTGAAHSGDCVKDGKLTVNDVSSCQLYITPRP